MACTFSLMVGAQPSFSLMRVLSEFRPRTPSGPGMWWIGRFLSSKLRTISAISFILTISSLPMFTGSRKSDFVNLKSHEMVNDCTNENKEIRLQDESCTLQLLLTVSPRCIYIYLVEIFQHTNSIPSWVLQIYLISTVNFVKELELNPFHSSMPTNMKGPGIFSLQRIRLRKRINLTREAIRIYLRTPSTHSSMKVKDRVWSPSPHISNLSVEVMAFLQKAAGAFSLPPK